MDRLAPLSEEPINEEDAKNSSKKGQSWRNWFKNQFPLFNKKSDLKILLSVLGCPLSPVSFHPKQSLIDAASSAQYIIQHFTAVTGCRKIEKTVKSVYATGKVKMAIAEELGGSVTAVTGVPQKGCFVVWQMVPDKWLLELVVSGHKVVAGSDGKGLDPVTVAAVFSLAQYTGEKKISDVDCFSLKLSADHTALADRSDSTAEIIKHVMIGYFSQRSGLLVYLEDSYLTRIQSPGSHPTYWETMMGSKIDDYRAVEGVMIAHSGRSIVSIARFGDDVKMGPIITQMEETWTIDDVVFNVPGLSMDCFIPPEEVQKDYPEQILDRRSPLHPC
ncbi:hypothetical protein HHK36_017626 [Tetracentron sinense]|uniref:Uncharacterized protein n=1 Tax=Tetracentron sinense TaxID=13715 RepID=A0A834YYI2_TETSI|nr:hypothetical protein HHK36_017626 [Tetracentron sinense]